MLSPPRRWKVKRGHEVIFIQGKFFSKHIFCSLAEAQSRIMKNFSKLQKKSSTTNDDYIQHKKVFWSFKSIFLILLGTRQGRWFRYIQHSNMILDVDIGHGNYSKPFFFALRPTYVPLKRCAFIYYALRNIIPDCVLKHSKKCSNILFNHSSWKKQFVYVCKNVLRSWRDWRSHLINSPLLCIIIIAVARTKIKILKYINI